MIDRREDRAVSVTVNYVMALALTAILISGLLIAGGSVLEDRRESVTREEFTVLGEQLAAGIGEADSMASTGAEDLRVAVRLPDSVGGSSYLVRVTEVNPPTDQPGEYVLTLSSPATEVSWNATVRTGRPIEETQVSGGSIVVVLRDDGGSTEFALVVDEEVGPN